MYLSLKAILSSFFLLFFVVSTSHGSTTLKITQANAPFSYDRRISWEDSLVQIKRKDDSRLRYLNGFRDGQKTWLPLASGRQIMQTSTYIVSVGVGTPPQPLLVAVDTSNDAAWIPCSGCNGCSSIKLDTTNSNTYKTLNCGAPQCKQVPNPSCDTFSLCSFNLSYAGSSFQAALSQDTITVGKDSITNYSFGCLQTVIGNSIPTQGLLGLGRGPMSFISQTQNLYNSTFSYCLPNFKSTNFSGNLRLGLSGQPTRVNFTPLLINPRRPVLYYVNMIGISVGKRLVNIPPSAFAFNPTTGGGTILDSGTMFTRLVEPAYIAVRDEFRRRVNGIVSTLGGFDTCYTIPITGPTITFHFTGMNMSLPLDNILIRSSSGSISCLAMAASPNNVNSVLNVIANMQQQNHRFLFDVANSRVGVSKELCT